MDDYRHVNRALWDERGPAHAASPDYNVQLFIDDPTFLSDVVRFDLPLLDDVNGLDGIHSSKRRSTTPPRYWVASSSTSCTPAWARWAGCRRFDGGAPW
jgi:hypothetical protein